MKGKLIFASTITLGILLSFVFFVFYLIAFWANIVDIEVLIILTVLTNFILWWVSPYLTDWIQKVFYKVRWVTFEEFSQTHGEIASFVKITTEKNNIKIPLLRIIDDANPTAYCYGSYPNNSRLVVSTGIFKYLDIEEQKAVFAHELGHIVNKDFIIMTIAITLLQVLYEVYYNFLRRRRSSRSKKGDITPLIGAISYVLYIIGSYMVLYLSRTREYLADRFSAEHTDNPDALSLALVKIAYGIAVEVEGEATQRLLVSTRAMGIYDFKAADSIGTVFKLAMGKDKVQIAYDLSKVFLFDIYSPWGLLSEINSTHPLTGKRIRALSQYARERGRVSIFDFEKVAQEGRGLDKVRLYRDFSKGLGVYALPYLGALVGLLIFLTNRSNYPLSISLIGASFLAQGLYKFRRLNGIPEKVSVFELMQDPYANPLRGRFVEIEGKVIGKADAGSYLGEDVKMQDKSGCLVYLNYESIIPVLGNIIFGLGRARRMIGQYSKAAGWFRRSSYQVVDLDTVEVQGEIIKSYTRFWGILAGILLLILGIILFITKSSSSCPLS
jgi:Zn-dependent protease with chaperone function